MNVWLLVNPENGCDAGRKKTSGFYLCFESLVVCVPRISAEC